MDNTRELPQEPENSTPIPDVVDPKQFELPSAETRIAFDTVLTELRGKKDLMETVHEKFVQGTLGNKEEDAARFVDIQCGFTQFSKDKERHPDRYNLEASIHAHPVIPEIDPMLGWSKLHSRVFRNGEIEHDNMTDEEFNYTMDYLQRTLSPATWEWITKALHQAQAPYDPDFLSFTVNDLLNEAPDTVPISEIKKYFFEQPIKFNNGSQIRGGWEEGNQTYRDKNFNEFTPNPLRSIELTTLTGETFHYIEYEDHTERMVVETRDPNRRAILEAEGLTVIAPEEWTQVGPQQRFEGVQSPNEKTMHQFATLLQTTLDSGISKTGK